MIIIFLNLEFKSLLSFLSRFIFLLTFNFHLLLFFFAFLDLSANSFVVFEFVLEFLLLILKLVVILKILSEEGDGEEWLFVKDLSKSFSKHV